MADTHVTIVGNLTDDPELRFTPQGVPVANFRVAVTERVREGDRWKDSGTSYYRVNVWRDQAQHVAESLGTGARVVVLGRLRQRSWETPRARSATSSRSRPTRWPPASGGRTPSPSAPPTRRTP